MKETFLNALKEALIHAKVENVEEIVSLYEQRFLLGYQANMSDEEIIEMLEDIDQIVAKAKKNQSSTSFKKEYRVQLDLTLFSSFKIELKKTEGISFDLDKNADLYVDVILNDHEAKIINKTKDGIYFNHHKGFDGIMQIGPDIFFQSFIINNTSCDVESCDLEGDDLLINNTSGDIIFNQLHFNTIRINSISGDLDMNKIEAKNFQINIVSGDTKIKELHGNDNFIKTTSGDVFIFYANNGNFNLKSVSGDICIKNGNVEWKNINANSISGNISVCGDRQEGLFEKMKWF